MEKKDFPDNKHTPLKKKLEDFRIEQTKAYRTYIKTSAVGLEFGLAIALGALSGYFFDKYCASSPYGLLVGVIIGSIAGVKRLLVFMKSYLSKEEKDDDE